MPAVGSDVHYLKTGMELSGYRELIEGVGIAGRFFAGQLWPKGGSRRQDDPVIENRFDQIRYYTGGSTDVRGWALQLAGPKLARPDVSSSDTLFVYEAIGGLAKLTGMVELRLPFPGLGPEWGTAVFLDGGRISERNFSSGTFRLGTGAGIRYATPVGLIRFDVAYKLNPDDADLRTAKAYYRMGTNADEHWSRRFSFHLSIGQSF